MPRFFIPTPTGDRVTLTGEDADHIGRSLRMRPGETLTLCDGETDYHATLQAVERGMVVLRIDRSHPNRTEPPARITLYQCLPKGDKLETIVRQATELGASRIVPVLSRRCVARPDAAAFDKRRVRLQRIAREAAGQSERGRIPEVAPLLPVERALEGLAGSDLAIFCYEGEGTPLSGLLRTLPASAHPPEIGLLIGSEGGFDPAEVAAARTMGIQPITLGPRILRTETAPIAALAILLAALEGRLWA